MSGLGLIGRRRAIASSPVKVKSLVKIYDRLVFKSGSYFVTDYSPCNYDRICYRMNPSAYPSLLFGARKGMGVVALANNSTTLFAAWESDAATQITANLTNDIEREVGMIYHQGGYRAVYRGKNATDFVTLKTYSGTPAEAVSKVPLYIGVSLVLNSDYGIDTRYFQGTFYGLQVVDSRTGDMKHDFVPAIYDGADAGIYDRISGNFYYNSGTGEVIAENE